MIIYMYKIGHVLRMENNRNVRTALDWAPEGKGKRGRPKETWRRTVEKERKQLGFICEERCP
jgi:hypothetical protein